jgi:hypothetical protein
LLEFTEKVMELVCGDLEFLLILLYQDAKTGPQGNGTTFCLVEIK